MSLSLSQKVYRQIGVEYRLPWWSPQLIDRYTYVPPGDTLPPGRVLTAPPIPVHQGHTSRFDRSHNVMMIADIPRQYYHGETCDPDPPNMAPARFYSTATVMKRVI